MQTFYLLTCVVAGSALLCNDASAQQSRADRRRLRQVNRQIAQIEYLKYIDPRAYYDAVEQPIGQRQIRTGPNRTESYPVYASDLARGATSKPAPPRSDAGRMVERAAAAFRDEKYSRTLDLLDSLDRSDRSTGVAGLLRSQALFAEKKYEPAATALRRAMVSLPANQWPGIPGDYRRYYASLARYADQLRALQNHVKNHPTDADARLLLGYHYGYLGYRSDALKQLAAAMRLSTDNSLVRQLSEVFGGKKAPIGRKAVAGKPDTKPVAGPREF
jgi:predicted Zn-dependent protease